MDMLKNVSIDKTVNKLSSNKDKGCKLGLTLGDPGGIGPEIIAKSLTIIFKENNGSLPFTPIIFGSKSVFENTYIKSLLPPLPLRYYEKSQIKVEDINESQISVIDCGLESIQIQNNIIDNKVSAVNGQLSFEYLTTAIDAALNGDIQGIVTGPVSKESWRLAGIDYTGHTTCLKALTQSEEVSMGFYSSKLKTVLATVHIPLSKVSSSLTEKHLDIALKNSRQLMRMSGVQNPKIALAGLNPHAGENGQFGTEEKDLLLPFVEKNSHHGLSGPYPPDTLYYRAYEGGFDCVISLYHDQGLIPLKLVAFHEAVNVTLGLPFIRTSPDHGTCFELYQQHKANPSSMTEAIKLLRRFVPQLIPA